MFTLFDRDLLFNLKQTSSRNRRPSQINTAWDVRTTEYTTSNSRGSTPHKTTERSTSMRTIKRSLLSLLIPVVLSSAAFAQDERPTNPIKDSFIVTAAINGERLRFTAPPSVVQIRLEVYNSTGHKIFENEVRTSNVLDWHLQDPQ